MDGTVDFNRDWKSYKGGFGKSEGENRLGKCPNGQMYKVLKDINSTRQLSTHMMPVNKNLVKFYSRRSSFTCDQLSVNNIFTQILKIENQTFCIKWILYMQCFKKKSSRL